MPIKRPRTLPQCAMSNVNVRYRGQPGRHLLTLSSSQFDPRPTSAAMRQYHRPHTVAERNVGALGFKLDARAPDGLRAGCDGAVTGFTASGVGIAGMPM
jgi:hypothetical protein